MNKNINKQFIESFLNSLIDNNITTQDAILLEIKKEVSSLDIQIANIAEKRNSLIYLMSSLHLKNKNVKNR